MDFFYPQSYQQPRRSTQARGHPASGNSRHYYGGGSPFEELFYGSQPQQQQLHQRELQQQRYQQQLRQQQMEEEEEELRQREYYAEQLRQQKQQQQREQQRLRQQQILQQEQLKKRLQQQELQRQQQLQHEQKIKEELRQEEERQKMLKQQEFKPVIDIKEKGLSAVIIRLELPGFKREDIEIYVNNLNLSVAGVRKEPTVPKEETAYFEEIEDEEIDYVNSTGSPVPSKRTATPTPSNDKLKKQNNSMVTKTNQAAKFHETFQLSKDLDLSTINAKQEDGVLTITINRKQALKPSFKVNVL
ncbi:hypothetical protein SAMD00019534_062640 [Acytostelium subglobosum LB1]|uniref:hypothetical protein n=1 Tax=Acytostelium subglobosum LB1 TaxID=1410327 RepID=UPI000644F18D|nr:hypothetical protein SAMD00019534_062640 [Acytostelium subglobosum LB1]GAM23089.1 hypothetical protein SAMD00019534_062640 [Acytostelium subglobosum LB1]|eukprot:XP_012754316.1 hypothetical protein SAMD00019534_062640 [Acytostelium subglobosum LB1]